MQATLNTYRRSAADNDMRAVQERWARTPIRERTQVITALRHRIAANAELLASQAAAVRGRPLEEKLTAEVLPLADACLWLERNAPRVLAPRRCGSRGRPLWLRGVRFDVQRQPFGVVLVIGPGNYPLFLPAVHSLYALVAGNAVVLKPAPGTGDVARTLARLAFASGLDPALLTILPESIEAAHEAIDNGVDKVVFTGSSQNGRDVLAALAEKNIPSVMELSGDDAVIVLADADLDLVVRALRFAQRLNDGDTCMAPRRLIVVDAVADALLDRLFDAHIQRLFIERVDDDKAAAQSVNASDFALGASIFSRDVERARALAAHITTGFVLINDIIVPTADPRMPFGGVRASGFGVTRGDEGLIEMTFAHVVAVNSSRSRPHFEETIPEDARLFSAYIRAAHGRRRFAAMRELLNALIDNVRIRKAHQ